MSAQSTILPLICVRSDDEKTTKNNEIKPQKTRGFNVENPSNAKGKNHGRQPARTSLYRVCVSMPNDGLQEE